MAKQNRKFRSKLEQAASLKLKDWDYETERLSYHIPKTYTPDFTLGDFYIEIKGYFRSGDTQKYAAIKRECDKQGIVLIFVWQNKKKKLRKGSKLTNEDWCTKHGIPCFNVEEIDSLKKWVRDYGKDS